MPTPTMYTALRRAWQAHAAQGGDARSFGRAYGFDDATVYKIRDDRGIGLRYHARDAERERLLREAGFWPGGEPAQESVLPAEALGRAQVSTDGARGAGEGEGAGESPAGQDGPPAERQEAYADGGNTMDLRVLVSECVQTLDDLLRVCKVDAATWEVERWEAKAYTVPMKLKRRELVNDVLHRLSDEAVQTQQFYVSARLRRKVAEVALRRVASDLLEDLRRAAPVYIARRYDAARHLLVMAFPDPHFGREAAGWDLETGLRVYAQATADILHKASGFDVARILVVTGNDATQIDSTKGQTTHGTQVEYAGSWHGMFRAAVRAYRQQIDACLDVAPVDVVNVPGNHDEHTAFSIGEVLAAVYENARHVTVDNSPPLRKYYEYGRSLFGLTHGRDEKSADLPLIMAQERPEAWARTSWREWMTGHLHQRRRTPIGAIEELQGVIVRILPALCPSDSWHERMGFVGMMRGAEGHVYSEDAGHVGSFTFTVPRDLPRAA